MATLLTILHLLIFAAVTLRVLARSDMLPTTRVAWIFVLLVVPAFGLLLPHPGHTFAPDRLRHHPHHFGDS